jgi:hypothetical protein
MKTGMLIAAAILIYALPSQWFEITVAVGIGVVLFWRVPEPWETSNISTRRASPDDSIDLFDSLGRGNDRGMDFNPTTGLPMADDLFDVAGNAYCTSTLDSHFE